MYQSPLDYYSNWIASVTDIDTTAIEQREEKILHIIIRDIPQSYEVSNKFINQILLKGYDINLQDENGKTAIHVATEIRNVNGLDTLLWNGADPNIVDNEGKTAFERSSENLIKGPYTSFEGSAFRLLGHYINKMRVAGCKVSKQNEVCYSKSLQFKFRYHDNLERFSSELDKMKTVYLSKNITLKAILSKSQNEMVRLVNNEILKRIINNIAIEFPCFGCLLKMQYTKGLVRMRLIESAKAALELLLNLNLPDLCSESILKYLNNNELRNLLSAAYSRNNVFL